MTTLDTLFIITGTTQGLGKDIFAQLSRITENIITINRSPFHHSGNIIFDFSNIEKIENDLFSKLNNGIANFDNVIIILNAGIIDPIKEIGNYESSDVIKLVNINIVSQVLLTNFIVKQNKNGITINITSGSAHNTNKGLGLYSLSKSAIHRFFEISDKECTMMQFINFDPGNMNTQMHEQLRREDNHFELMYKKQLQKQYQNGDMKTPRESAQRLVNEILNLMDEV